MRADGFEPVEPAHLLTPKWDYTLGPEVADLCALFGFAPDPEQEAFLDAVFGVRDGLPAAEEAIEIAGRQNLKSAEFEMTAFGWLFITKEQRILWSAHEVPTSKDSFLHMTSLLERKPWAMKLVRRFYFANGNYSIVMRDGRSLEFTARTTSGGRGKSAPKSIWDEALELQAEHLSAQDAVKSTFPWAQQLVGSSGAKSYSEVLHGYIRRGRAAEGDRTFYREFADDLPGDCRMGAECTHVYGLPGCRLDDRRRWKRANPALGRMRPDGRGLTERAIAIERRNQPDPMKFGRERLTWHEELVASDGAVFSEEAWSALRRPKSRVRSRLTLALHVSPGRDWSAVVAGGLNADDRVHLEVPSKWADSKREARMYARWPSTDRVVSWFRKFLAKRRDETITLVILAGSQAAALLPALRRLNMDPRLGDLDIVVLPEAQLPQACGHMLDLVSTEALAHVGDPELQTSMLAVSKRMVGDKTFVWSPRASSGDITAAMAATLLAWHLEQVEDYDVEDSVG